MSERTLRGRVAVVGAAETEYYRWGKSPDPEFKLAIEAVLKACADAGIDPRDVDGFSSYSNDRSEASRQNESARTSAAGRPRARNGSSSWAPNARGSTQEQPSTATRNAGPATGA